jgi:predicted PurR-regulated permease PerM
MITLLALGLLWQFRTAAVYVLISLILAAALRPLVNRLVGRRFIVRMVWILFYLVALVSFGFLLFLTGKAVINDIKLVAQTVSMQDAWRLPLWLQGSSVQQVLVASLPPPSKLFLALTGSQGQLVLPALLGFTQNMGDVISGALVILFLCIYWTINQIHFERLWLSLLSSSLRKQVRDIWRIVEPELGTYIRSEIIQSLLAGLLLGLGYWLLGSPYPTLLAVSGAFLWLIPVMGAPLALILPLIIGLLTSAQVSLFTVLYTLLVLIAMELWVEPRLFRHKWDNPILTLVIILAMADAFGIVGILVAPPLSAVCQILWNLLISRRIVAGAALRVSDLKDRQARVWENIKVMDGPHNAMVTSSMERLTGLLEKAEPILQASLPTDIPEPFQSPQPVTSESGLPESIMSKRNRR